MKIRNEREEIDFSVVGYQFPDSEKSKPKDFNYDANWLRIQVIHTKDGKSETFEDSCLLTYELETLAGAAQLFLPETLAESERELRGYLWTYPKR